MAVPTPVARRPSTAGQRLRPLYRPMHQLPALVSLLVASNFGGPEPCRRRCTAAASPAPLPSFGSQISGHQHIHERADVVKLFQTLHQFDYLAKVLTLQHAIGAILELVLQCDGRERVGRMALRVLDRRAERAVIPERDR